MLYLAIVLLSTFPFLIMLSGSFFSFCGYKDAVYSLIHCNANYGRVNLMKYMEYASLNINHIIIMNLFSPRNKLVRVF